MKTERGVKTDKKKISATTKAAFFDRILFSVTRFVKLPVHEGSSCTDHCRDPKHRAEVPVSHQRLFIHACVSKETFLYSKRDLRC